MVRGTGRHGILGAIPGAWAALRWLGWLGIALLVVPAVVLAVLVSQGKGQWGADWILIALALAGLLSLVVVGLVLFVTLSSLRRLGELAQLLGEEGPQLVFVKDRQHRYRYANVAAAALIGRHPASIFGRLDSELHPGSESLVFEENDRICLERDLPTVFRETQTTPGGQMRNFRVSKRPLHDARGRTVGLLGTARDITDELELQKLLRLREEETRVWFELGPLPAVLFATADLRILDANVAAERCYGYSRTQLQRMHLPELFARGESDRIHKYLGDKAQAVPPGSLAWRHRKADGSTFAALADIGNLPHAEVPARLMLVRDVSELDAMRAALESCRARYKDLVDSGLTMVWTHDLDGRLLEVNSTMADALGYEREDMLGRGLDEFVPEDARDSWKDYVERIRSLRRDAGMLHVAARSGERRIWQYHFVCYPDAEPTPYVLGTAQDVTLRHRYEIRMREQNRRDPLTGCHTRRYLDAFAWRAEHDQVWGCVVVDIDYFRQLNASEGRERGDDVLRDLADVLRLAADTGDAVVRMGGDEFAVVVAHATENHLQELAERLAASARVGMPAAFSIGWALREGGEELESTLRRADKRLLANRMRDRG